MIYAELISFNRLESQFFKFCEQLQLDSPGAIVQKGKRPRSEKAMMLAYLKAFNNPDSDTADVKALLGFLHFGMLCAGPDMDMMEVMGWPHGLKCLKGPFNRKGVTSLVISGDGDQWATSIQNAGRGSDAVREWGVAVHGQFVKHNLDEIFGKIKPIKPNSPQSGYYLN